jgi:hypothetical protein
MAAPLFAVVAVPGPELVLPFVIVEVCDVVLVIGSLGETGLIGQYLQDVSPMFCGKASTSCEATTHISTPNVRPNAIPYITFG